MEKLSKEDFEKQVLESTAPVVVDLYADWCMPCKSFAPLLEQVESELEGEVRFFKVDVDADASLANHYRVMSVPTTVLFANGEERDRMVGALAKGQIKSFVGRAL